MNQSLDKWMNIEGVSPYSVIIGGVVLNSSHPVKERSWCRDNVQVVSDHG